uniref:Uncharacterized protein n=1 Tax=viral metagenome TaxID=1070528 RepID=A0A6M3J013_9ZZZZ
MIFGIELADRNDKHASHFILSKIGQLRIWYSWEIPIAFKGRKESGVLDDRDELNFNQDRHACFAEDEINKGKRIGTGIIPFPVKVYTSRTEFFLALSKETEKEIIHLSSKIMCSEFGVK